MDPVQSGARTPGILARHPELRWLFSVVLIVAAVAIFASYVSGAFRDDDSGLAATGPEQVVSQVRATHTGYTGTILAKVDLGLPRDVISTLARELPYGGALLNGSHTLRYWYGGQDKQRIAIMEPNAEQDVFRNGHQMTLWNSAGRTFERHDVTQTDGPLPISAAPAAALTPPLLAGMVLATAAPARTTTLRSSDPVPSGRPAYELDVEPNSPRSLIGSVHIQIDGREAVPLGVQIYPRGASQPAIDVAFTSISYGAPEERNFSFVPPPDAHARTGLLGTDDIETLPGGWLSLLALPPDPLVATTVERAFGPSMLRVKGKWGSGRVYSAGMLSLLATNSGQVVAGAVAPRVLYAAAAR